MCKILHQALWRISKTSQNKKKKERKKKKKQGDGSCSAPVEAQFWDCPLKNEHKLMGAVKRKVILVVKVKKLKNHALWWSLARPRWFSTTSWRSYGLQQGSANFSVKGQRGKYVRLFKPYGFCHNYSALLLKCEKHP